MKDDGLLWSDSILGNRKGAGTLSDRTFMFVLGLYVTIGLAASAYTAAFTYTWQPQNAWIYMFIGLLIPLGGIYISFKSPNWLISTIGYAMVFIPMGAILGPFVALYQMSSVIQAVVITLLMSCGLWFIGTIFPPIVKNWAGYIIAMLLVLIAGDVARGVMPAFGIQPVILGIWPWVGIALFSALIVYDVNKAMNGRKTMDDAADGAVAIYLDIVNIFVRVLEVTAKKK
jgi:FtsH-binding integral membrane protein